MQAGLQLSRAYRPLLVATGLIGLLVFFWGLGDIALMSFNEARRALPSSEMYLSGDWLLPRLNGELYLTKPPFLYWLAAGAGYLLGGMDEWAVRLPSALSALLMAVVTYRYVRTHFGDWPALFSVQLLIANAGFAMLARRAEIEMLLALLCCSALLAALHFTRGGGCRRWLWLSYALLGLAMLTKGPLVLLFVTLPLLVDAMLAKSQRGWAALRDPVGWTLFLLIGLSWYLAVTVQMGLDVWQTTVQRDMLQKMQGPSGEPVYAFLLWILGDFFPASLVLLIAPLLTWKRWKARGELIALLVGIAVPFLVFSAFSDKHAKYLLPIYPLIAILLGVRLGELFQQAKPALQRGLIAAGLLLPLGYAVFFAAIEPRVFDYRVSVFPKFAAWLQTTPADRLYAYRDVDERLVYYAGRSIPVIDEAQLEGKRAAGEGFLLLVPAGKSAEAEPASDCLVQEFAPYLKKRRSLKVLGYGASCPALHGA